MASARHEEQEDVVDILSIGPIVDLLQSLYVVAAQQDLNLLVLSGAIAGRLDALGEVPVFRRAHAHAVGEVIVSHSEVLRAGGEVGGGAVQRIAVRSPVLTIDHLLDACHVPEEKIHIFDPETERTITN